jgi:hypothetical protein
MDDRQRVRALEETPKATAGNSTACLPGAIQQALNARTTGG